MKTLFPFACLLVLFAACKKTATRAPFCGLSQIIDYRDSNGGVLADTTFIQYAGDLQEWVVGRYKLLHLSYDAAGWVTERTLFDRATSEPIYKETLTHNADGTIASYLRTFLSGPLPYVSDSTHFTYTNGKLTQQVDYQPDQNGAWRTREAYAFHWTGGNMTALDHFWDGYAMGTTTYTYDDQPNLLRALDPQYYSKYFFSFRPGPADLSFRTLNANNPVAFQALNSGTFGFTTDSLGRLSTCAYGGRVSTRYVYGCP